MENAAVMWIMGLANGLILLLVAIAVKGIAGINSKLAGLMTDMGKTKTWEEQHDKQDDERHENVTQKIDRIWEKIDARR